MTATLSALNIDVTEVAPTKPPVLPTRSLTSSIRGVQTSVIVQLFADRVFVTVTQLNKFGCLYQASTSANPGAESLPDEEIEGQPSSEPNAHQLPPPLPSTSISKLIGTEPSPAHAALYELYVSQITSIVKHSAPSDVRPLIVSLALKVATQRQRQTADSEGQDSDEEDDLLMDEGERERFLGIMNLTQECVNSMRY